MLLVVFKFVYEDLDTLLLWTVSLEQFEMK